MAEWKKTNEAYFGDSFNRDSTLCSAANIHATVDDDVATKAINWNYDGHYGINTLNELCNYAATMTDVNQIARDKKNIEDAFEQIRYNYQAVQDLRWRVKELEEAPSIAKRKRRVTVCAGDQKVEVIKL